jgi:hypothetical protein
MIDPVDRAVRAIARRNSFALVWAQHLLAHAIRLGGPEATRGGTPSGGVTASGRGARGRAGAAPVSD